MQLIAVVVPAQRRRGAPGERARPLLSSSFLVGNFSLVLRKQFWLLNLLVVGICSVLGGRAAASLLRGAYLSDVDVPRVIARPMKPTAPHAKDGNAIVQRDIFCSGCAPKTPDKPVEARGEPQKSTLPLALESITLSTDEKSSLAVIRELSTPKRDVDWFTLGEPVFATGATVERIAERRVYLHTEAGPEYLDLDDPPPGAPPPMPPPRFAANDALSSEMDRSIACRGASCQVDRSLIDHLLQNPMALATSARIIPAIMNGRPAGFRLYAIRPGSLFARIGLQNGDLVKSINGNEMHTPDQALEIYTKLRYASHLSVEVDRRGSTQTLDYGIR